jgi:hypothetical protein
LPLPIRGSAAPLRQEQSLALACSHPLWLGVLIPRELTNLSVQEKAVGRSRSSAIPVVRPLPSASPESICDGFAIGRQKH